MNNNISPNDEIEIDKALDKIYAALGDLSAAGLKHLATTIKLTIENQLLA